MKSKKVKHNYVKDEKNNVLIYTYTNEKGITTEKRIPIFDEKGNFTEAYQKEIQKKQAKEFFKGLKNLEKNTKILDENTEVLDEAAELELMFEEVNEDEIIELEVCKDVEIVQPETTALMIPETKLAVIDYEEAPVELKKKKKFTWKKFLVIVGLIGGGLFLGSKLEGCGEKINNNVTISSTPTPGPTNVPEKEQVSPTPTPIVIPTVEEQLEDSRYTEITNEAFEETVFNLQKELTAHGINLNGEDVVKFVTLANFTHMQETNPELLKTIMGKETDPQQFITKCAQVIGQTVYLEVTDKNEQVNWTVALMDEKDRTIAEDYMNNVVYAAKEYAEGNPIIDGGTYATREEKRVYIESLVATGYIAKDFDKTVDVQEIGADFVTDAIVTGILLNDTAIKQFISTKEVIDELKIISSNKDVVSNLHALISTVGCEEKAKTLTLK